MPGKFFIGLLLLFSLAAFSQPNPKLVSEDDSIGYYKARNNSDKVIYFSGRELERVRKNRKKDQNREAQLLQFSGDALRRLGKLPEAEKTLLQSLEIQQSASGEFSERTASVHFSLGNLYNRFGNYPLSEFHYQKSLKIRKYVLGEEHPEVANSCYGLGNLNVLLGNYAEAEYHLLNSLQIGLKRSNETDWKLADTYNAIGNLYMEWNRLQEAEQYFLKAIESGKNTPESEGLASAYPYNNLGNLYEKLGNYVRAKSYFLKYLEMTQKRLGEDHPDVADAYNNLGVLFLEKGDFKQAEDFLKKSMHIKLKNLGENHPEIASTHLNLGTLKYLQNEFKNSAFHYNKSLEITNLYLREYHPDRANLYNNLAGVYWKLGDFKKSETFYLKSLDIFKKTLGEQSFQVVQANNRLGILYLDWGRPDVSENYFRLFADSELDLIKRFFPFLSEDEKEKFLDREKPFLEAFQSFCIERYESNPSIAGLIFNQQLATKGLLLNNSEKWRQAVKTSSDSVVRRLFDQWSQSQLHLNQIIQSTDSVERMGLDSIQQKTEKLEKELSFRSLEFSRITDRKPIGWEHIQKGLKPGEAAIEIIRIRKFGEKEQVTDSSEGTAKTISVKGLTDSICYAAVIIKPEWKTPEITLIKNGNDLEGSYLKAYKKSIRNFKQDTESYKRFWAPIAKKLGSCRVVYFSPDGVFHKINPLTLWNPKTGGFLLDEIELRLVTSTKDILQTGSSTLVTKNAVLIGNPKFSQPDSTSPKSINPALSESWSALPKSKVEIEKIGNLLRTNGWKTMCYLSDSASELALKQTKNPALLHVASHGFFRSDSSLNLPALHRSGLVLAKMAGPAKSEDGILVSAEAMNLHLENTKLVVLSACETGLGEIKNGEGVFGLQRAFKVAGAESILMSLWKVSDEATQELMVRFYKHWLGPEISPKIRPANTLKREINSMANPGDSKKLRSAFLKAQKELKSKYPHPFHWGAFVLLSE